MKKMCYTVITDCKLGSGCIRITRQSMRLLTAGPLVRVQHGEPNPRKRYNACGDFYVKATVRSF